MQSSGYTPVLTFVQLLSAITLTVSYGYQCQNGQCLDWRWTTDWKLYMSLDVPPLLAQYLQLCNVKDYPVTITEQQNKPTNLPNQDQFTHLQLDVQHIQLIS